MLLEVIKWRFLLHLVSSKYGFDNILILLEEIFDIIFQSSIKRWDLASKTTIQRTNRILQLNNNI